MANNPSPASTRRAGPVARGVAASAVIVAAGQLLSRVMGLLRVTSIASVFGAGGQVSSFNVASTVPTMVYDLLLGGMVSAALVPVLSEYVGRGDIEELSRVTSILLTLGVAFFAGIVAILELAAPLLAILLGGGFQPELQRLTISLIRIILPSLIFFCAWGIAVAVLYARQQFIFPALAAAVFNLGVILATVFIAPHVGIAALSMGVVLGAFLQLAIVVPGLRGLRLRPRFEPRHPALRRIILLYLPVIASLVVSQLGIIIDRNLASRTVDQAIAWMFNATQLIQLPLGLVSVAIATATLPVLARLTDDPQNVQFRRTLAGALRLVLVLIVPAAVGLLVLAPEGVRLFLERGVFTPFDTSHVTRALLFYLPGLPFAAVDQPIVFAFYARKDTVTPVLVGIAGVGAYLLVGPLLAFVFHIGFIGLVIANSVQLTTHCIIMWVLLERKVGSMAGLGLLTTVSKAMVAAGAMGLAAIAALAILRPLVPAGSLGQATLLLLAGSVAVGIYVLGLIALRVEELTTLLNMIRSRLGRLAGA